MTLKLEVGKKYVMADGHRRVVEILKINIPDDYSVAGYYITDDLIPAVSTFKPDHFVKEYREPREWWIRYPKMMADMHRMIGSSVCVPEVWPDSDSHPTVNGFPNDEWIKVREIE